MHSDGQLHQAILVVPVHLNGSFRCEARNELGEDGEARGAHLGQVEVEDVGLGGDQQKAYKRSDYLHEPSYESRYADKNYGGDAYSEEPTYTYEDSSGDAHSEKPSYTYE